MEKKSGIVVTQGGLFIPAYYFRRMADRLEVVLYSGEIRIRSSAKGQPPVQKLSTKRKTSYKGRRV